MGKIHSPYRSDRGAELLRRHPQLTPMTNVSIWVAVRAFCDEDGGWGEYGDKTADFRHSPKAEAKHGPVGLWDVSEVTCMDHLFQGCTNFNEDVSAWDMRRVENLAQMFHGASSFNQPLGAWVLRPGALTHVMFYEATVFDRAANSPWYEDDEADWEDWED